MLKKLKIRNFKSWVNTEEIHFSKITGFFGTNSSGKTSLLQFLLLLKQSAESSDRNSVLFFGDERTEVSLGTFKDVIFKHDTNQKLSFDLNWDLIKSLKIDDISERNKILFEGNNINLELEIGQEKDNIEVQNMIYSFANHKFQLQQKSNKKYSLTVEKIDKKTVASSFKAIRTQGRGWELPEPIKYYGFPEQIKTYYQNIGFLADLQLEVEKLFSRVYYLGPLRDYPKRDYTWAGANKQAIGSKGEYVIEALLSSRNAKTQIKISPRKKLTVEEYVAHWLKELELIHDFKVEELAEGSNRYQVKVRKTPESSEVLITDVGFGVSQILPVITLCYYAPEHSILIMEQPEIHLHPKVQAGLADVFIDAVQKRNIQIVIESHSEHLLTRMQRRIAEEKVSNEDIKLYFCQSVNGHSELESLNIDLFGNITNWPNNFFGNEMEEKFAIAEATFKRSTNGTN